MWEFLDIYKDGILITSTYRNNLINTIRNKYNAEEYYKLEMQVDKMYWDIRNKIGGDISYEEYELPELSRVKLKLRQDNYYRSFINKVIAIDDENKKIYYRKMEGSPDMLNKNNDNCMAMHILLDRNLYEKVMGNQIEIADIKLPEYYLELDYGFPNFNFSRHNIGSKKYRMKRIKKMLYCDDCEKNWYQVITP